MGYLAGLLHHDAGMRYGDARSVAFTEEVTKALAMVGWEAGELAKEKARADHERNVQSHTRNAEVPARDG